MLKELLHKLSYRKIELVSRIDEEKSKVLMDLINNKNVNDMWIQEKLCLYKNKEERKTRVVIHFKPIRNLAQYRSNMLCIEKLDMSFRKHMMANCSGVYFSSVDDFDCDLWMHFGGMGEEKRMELLGAIMGCEIIKITSQVSEYSTDSFACKTKQA